MEGKATHLGDRMEARDRDTCRNSMKARVRHLEGQRGSKGHRHLRGQHGRPSSNPSPIPVPPTCLFCCWSLWSCFRYQSLFWVCSPRRPRAGDCRALSRVRAQPCSNARLMLARAENAEGKGKERLKTNPTTTQQPSESSFPQNNHSSKLQKQPSPRVAQKLRF